MKFHATASTTSGELALFWPATLPADLPERFADPTLEPDDVIAELVCAGQLLLIPTPSTRDQHLALLVDEPIPAPLEAHCTLAGKVDALQVAGEGRFVGIDFLFADNRWLLDKPPSPGLAIQIPPGTFFAEIFATEVPDDVYETWLREEAGSSAQRWWWIQTWIAAVGVVTLLIFVVCLFFATRQLVYVSLGISSFFLCIAWLMSRTAGYRRVQQARRDYHETYPDFVVRLRYAENEAAGTT